MRKMVEVLPLLIIFAKSPIFDVPLGYASRLRHMAHVIARVRLHTCLKPQRIQRRVFTSYITHFRRAVYRKFQFKKFSNLDITKKLAKKKLFSTS